MTDILYDALHARIDPARCLDMARRIWTQDRLFSFDAFGRTAACCAGEMAALGLSEVERLPLLADGKTLYGDWVIPKAWDAVAAQLTLLEEGEPGAALAAYPETPCSLVMYSAPTPREGVRAEVAWAERPEDLSGMEVRGKIIFTGAPPQTAVPLAVAGGALGIVSDFMPLYPGVRDSREAVYDVNRWENAFCVPRNDTGLFAFSLSPRQGDWLRARLRQGPAWLLARVETRLYEGTADTVSGLIPGETEEEVLGFGHLYEPGAHDNASGCAALLQAARALSQCIREGTLKKPRRGIRIGMGFECGGSMGYLMAHPDRVRRMKAGLVVDMAGTQEADRTELTLWHNPRANMAPVDGWVADTIRAIQRRQGAPFPFREKVFSIGTDNILADPCFGMPTVALIAEPALSYHSSLDTIDRLQPNILARNTLLAALHLYALANAPAEALAPAPAPALAPVVSDSRVPLRRVPGCLNLEAGEAVARMTAEERARWQPAWNGRLNIPLFWADGRRTVGEIAALSAWELSVADAGAYGEELSAYFTFLAKYGYVSL